ncbi:MAG: DUF1501 domain-containing protein, partial [Gemmataceae bacterium]
MDRRAFLATTTAAVLASNPNTASAATVVPSRRSAEQVLLIQLVGGASQLETWDPKPLAPTDIRGPFHPRSTAVPGIA